MAKKARQAPIEPAASNGTSTKVAPATPNDTGNPLLRNRVRELRMVRAADIDGAVFNWRNHPQSQVEALAGSIEELGFIDPLDVREIGEGRYQLWDGHARRDLIHARIGPDTLIPCVVTDLTEEEAKKANLIKDPLAAMAEADAAKLDALLREVQTGSQALASMLTELAEANPLQPNLHTPGGGGDEFDATPAEGPTRCQPGDLWLIGGVHRLLIGDSTKAEDVARLMGGATPFLMATDPPCGVEYDAAWRDEAAAAGLISHAARRVAPVANDDRVDWTDAWKLASADVVYCWHADRHASEVQRSLEEAGYEIRCQVVWAKQMFAISRGHYHWQHEPCWYAVRKDATARWSGDRSQSTLWTISWDKNVEGGHSTQKPIECMARPIRNHGEPGDIIYDPFLGSGTTLIAGHRLGRKVYGCEIEPRYCDVILKRAAAENLTAEKVN